MQVGLCPHLSALMDVVKTVLLISSQYTSISDVISTGAYLFNQSERIIIFCAKCQRSWLNLCEMKTQCCWWMLVNWGTEGGLWCGRNSKFPRFWIKIPSLGTLWLHLHATCVKISCSLNILAHASILRLRLYIKSLKNLWGNSHNNFKHKPTSIYFWPFPAHNFTITQSPIPSISPS